jgi:transposase
MPGRTHSREFKLDIVNQVNGGQKTTAQLCREHVLSPSLIHCPKPLVGSHAL